MWLLLVKNDSLKNQTETIWCLQRNACVVLCKRCPSELQGSSLEEVQPPGQWVYLWDTVYRTCRGLAVPTLYYAGGSRYILRDYWEDVVVPFCFTLLPSLDGCSNVLPRVEAGDSLSIWAVDSAETRFGSSLIPLGWLGPLLHWVCSLSAQSWAHSLWGSVPHRSRT